MLHSLQKLLLITCLPLASVAVAAPIEPLALEARVLAFAQTTLLAQAERDGFAAPQLQVQLLPTKGRAVASHCASGWQVQVLDARALSRLRYSAQCAASGERTELLVRAQLSADVLVARQPVSSGRALSADDVELQRRDITATPDAVSDISALEGLSPRSSLRAGQLLQKRQLQPALLVRRGDKVRILARQSGIEVQGLGEALDSGARDAQIRVRNSASGRTITARVLEPGVVEPVGP